MVERDELPITDEAAAYVLGALSAEETARFEAALARHPELQREVARWREVTVAMAEAVEPPAPSPGLRDRAVAAMLATPTPARDTTRRDTVSLARLPAWIALAAGIGAVALFGVAWLRQRAANQRLTSMATSLQRDLDQTRSQLASSREMLEVLLAPDMQMDLVESTGPAAPVLRLFRDPKRRVAIAMAQHLPPAPAGRTYQLWFIRDGVPVPSVTFNTGADGSGQALRVELPADNGSAITAAAVSEEPAGGSKQPTTTPFLVGALTE